MTSTKREVQQVQEALRRMLGSPDLTLERQAFGDVVNVRVRLRVVGTVDVIDDGDGRSWVATIPVLRPDLG